MEDSLRLAAWTEPQESPFFSPLVQASAPRTVRGLNLSHIRKTLSPGVPAVPLLPASFEAVGQWPVCYAGASLTEDRCNLDRVNRTAIYCQEYSLFFLPFPTGNKKLPRVYRRVTSIESHYRRQERAYYAYQSRSGTTRWHQGGYPARSGLRIRPSASGRLSRRNQQLNGGDH